MAAKQVVASAIASGGYSMTAEEPVQPPQSPNATIIRCKNAAARQSLRGHRISARRQGSHGNLLCPWGSHGIVDPRRLRQLVKLPP
jgi:hypothetical protein